MTRPQSARQSFLGDESDGIFQRTRVGVFGLGGGGSHIVQQLAHVGFEDLVLFDADVVELTNLNRLVGATRKDADRSRRKVDVATRLVQRLNPGARVHTIAERWQTQPEWLRSCDLAFGCVDTFLGRDELEAACLRYLIPLIDIGMDVVQAPGTSPRMAGQVILSLPDHPCMKCLGFLSAENLAREAANYGAAGGRPQVVWSNGTLASVAVGIGVDLLTGWAARASTGVVYLSYDGNEQTLRPHPRLDFIRGLRCPHYPRENVGEPRVERL